MGFVMKGQDVARPSGRGTQKMGQVDKPIDEFDEFVDEQADETLRESNVPASFEEEEDESQEEEMRKEAIEARESEFRLRPCEGR